MSCVQIAMAMWQPGFPPEAGADAFEVRTQVLASVDQPSGSAGGDCVRFGFHVDTLQGCTCEVNVDCRKMLYRTKIGREASGTGI